MYNKLYDYARVEEALLKKPSGDPLVVCWSLATNTTCVGYTCYAMSCLGCCCCTKCAGECIQQGDIGSYWKDSMEALYTSTSLQQRRDIFQKAMLVLREIQVKLTYQLKERVATVNETIHQGNPMEYTKNQFEFLMLTQELNDGSWIQTVLRAVRNYLLNIPKDGILSPVVLTVYDRILITPEMYRVLCAALGYFLPATRSKYGLSPLNPAEITAIQKISI
jgi:hypothetical protein